MISEEKYNELKAQNNYLRKENATLLKWRKAFEKAPYSMAVYDFLRGYYYPNEALSHDLGLDQPLSKAFLPQELYNDPDTANQILDAMISGDFWAGEVGMKKGDGEIFFADLKAQPIKDMNDEAISLIALHQDFPENKLLKEQKEIHFQYLQTLQSITLGMIRRLDLSNLLNVIIAKACSLTQISNGFIFLYDSIEEKLILKAACGRYKEHIGCRLVPTEGIVGEVFESKEPVITGRQEYCEDQFTTNIFKDVDGIIGVPLVSGSRLHGVIGLSDNEGKINYKLITILEELSSIATIAIDHSQLYSNLQEEFQKRLEIEKESKEQERQAKEIVKKQNMKLKQSYIDSLHRLVLASEYKDEDTGDHITRIGEYSQVFAQKLGWSDEQIEIIKYAAPMHDVGKIGIPDKIMLKPGKLSDEEFDIIKEHTKIGARLLSKSDSDILKMAREIALYHHEKYNGKGYPSGLSKDQIPISARIVALVDTFDALTSKRPYKDPYPPEMALDIIRKEKGEHFDPKIVDLFIENFDVFLNVRQTIGRVEEINLESFVISERDDVDFNQG